MSLHYDPKPKSVQSPARSSRGHGVKDKERVVEPPLVLRPDLCRQQQIQNRLAAQPAAHAFDRGVAGSIPEIPLGPVPDEWLGIAPKELHKLQHGVRRRRGKPCLQGRVETAADDCDAAQPTARVAFVGMLLETIVPGFGKQRFLNL